MVLPPRRDTLPGSSPRCHSEEEKSTESRSLPPLDAFWGLQRPPAPAACKASQDLREIPQRSVPEACAHQQTHGQTDRGRLHSTGWTDKQKLRRATFTLCRVEARAPAFYLPTVAWAVSSSLTPPARPSYLWVGGRDSVKPRGPGAQRPRASGR